MIVTIDNAIRPTARLAREALDDAGRS